MLSLENTHNQALAKLTIVLTERVRTSCLSLSEAELGVLARSMAKLELKYAGYASTTLCERAPVGAVALVPTPPAQLDMPT